MNHLSRSQAFCKPNVVQNFFPKITPVPTEHKNMMNITCTRQLDTCVKKIIQSPNLWWVNCTGGQREYVFGPSVCSFHLQKEWFFMSPRGRRGTWEILPLADWPSLKLFLPLTVSPKWLTCTETQGLQAKGEAVLLLLYASCIFLFVQKKVYTGCIRVRAGTQR